MKYKGKQTIEDHRWYYGDIIYHKRAPYIIGQSFGEGEYLAGFRSPHNSPNNIVYLENVYPEKLMRYFPKLGENVIVINGISTDVQSRLNGQDLDSDMVYVTNQPQILEAARIAYKEYPTIINNNPIILKPFSNTANLNIDTPAVAIKAIITGLIPESIPCK